jgi:putative hydrolase of HD superfamily
LDLISRYLGSDEAKLESETLQRYMEMMRRNLEYKSFSVGGIAEQLYDIKTEERRGWLARGLKAVESVADHTYGAYLLGLIYLPESAPLIEEYDKREILDMLLIHDLGEAFVGDLLPAQKNEVERKKEREAYEYIGTLGTYAGVGNLERVKILWDKFEQKTSINARVANDIDKLENLMQLHVYQRAGREVEHANEWQRDLAGEVETAIGRDILDVIRKQFAVPRSYGKWH